MKKLNWEGYWIDLLEKKTEKEKRFRKNKIPGYKSLKGFAKCKKSVIQY